MFPAVSRLLPLIALSAVCLSACGKKADDTKGARGPANVGVMAVQQRPISLTQDLAGRTSAWLVSEVRPQVSGIVKARQFTEGALVSAGQSLYLIDPASYQASYNSAQANLQQAEAALESARTRAGRAGQLVTIKAISQQEHDDAVTALKQAEASVAQQRASLQSAGINLNYTKVAAPISGRIGKSSVTPGALVTASQATPLATIQDTSKVYVDITQSSAEVLKLKKAIAGGKVGAVDQADVQLLLEDGSTYSITGKLQFSDVSVNPSTGAVTLRAVFANPDGLLLPGMFVRARLVTGTVPDAVLIPQNAVALDPRGGASVLLAGPDNKAKKQNITVAEMIGKEWRVTSGLKPGDKVIIDGALNLRDGAPIKPAPVKAANGTEK
ncbi:acriflavine resistance protein E [Asticcacaulis biprosthecium C19]|uniref:Acriflavine resistance protein E n=1 Tax=Asticcacaulis biprosthecium C19 TaxID=715226 RepID=F4QLZ2_9CAUL|nr:efflux RND transporter periplasmic adaptor subunit [Asticcacaulis biprosthecium]EGF93564.1 acriflavine resistance protein E [Asticcacaulis biprosthecium C19]